MAFPVRSRARHGLTLIETAAAVASLSLLGTVGVAGVSAARKADMHTNCSARLAAIGAGNGQFALANQDLMFGLTWQPGGANSQYPDLNALQAWTVNGAHAAQVIDILRRRGRPDMPAFSSWIPDAGFASVALLDFQDRTLADPFNLCPSDDNLNKWRRWPTAFDQGRLLPMQPNPSTVSNKRHPYSSSYSITAAAWDRNQSDLSSTAVSRRVSQNGNAHNLYTVPSDAGFGPSAMSSVAFPSQKVHLHDLHQRHLPGHQLYFMYPEASLPILFFDGSVRVETSGDARGSWNPSFPSSSFPTVVQYSPMAWDPPNPNGHSIWSVSDPYRFTREGLLGWDFEN